MVKTTLPGVNIHAESVELFQALHTVDQQHYGSSPLHCLHSPRQQVWSHGLKVLEYTHAISITKDLVGFFVVTVANICGGYEHLKRVLLVNVHLSCFNFLVQLFHFLLSVTRKPQLFLVTPKNIWSCFYCSF